MLEAADEIELLRIGVAEALRERDEANATIVTLRAERDGARREICRMVFTNGGIPPIEYARIKGWDCFKENDQCPTSNL